MEFSHVVTQRQSIREFSAAEVEEEKLRAVLEAAIAAPSAGNLQAYHIYVARRHRTRKALARAALDQGFIAQAPVVVVFCAAPGRSAVKYGSRGATLYAVQDATIACTFAMLAATDQGLSSVWVGAFDDDAARSAIGAPRGHRPVAILPLGYAAEQPPRRPRRSLTEAVQEVD